MTLEISSAHNGYRLAGTLSHLNLGAGAARVRLYPTPRPALGGTPAGAMLVEIGLTNPAGSVAGGVLTLTPAADGVVATGGVATWARVVNGNGDLSFDCDVTALAGAGEIKMASTTLISGGAARITSAVLG